MNTRRTPIGVFATALAAAAMLAGCGDDEKTSTAGSGTATTPATSAPAGTSPAGGKGSAAFWAADLCTALAKDADPVQPPAIDSPDAAKAKESMVKFFGTVTDQMSAQLKVLEDAGAPPEVKADKTYDKALQNLTDTRDRLEEVKDGLADRKAENAADVQALVTELGKELGSLSSYQGPVQELSKNPGLAPVFAAAPSCAKVL